jgi:hypothetical protein
MSASDTPQLLKTGDLFADQEVSSAEADRLSHSRIADQLAELVETVPARSNVALYGPWGSGKSGIGNLLREAVTKRKGTRFARFDAYKYAEAPLRRNFISAVATQLGITKQKYHRDLYTGRTRTDIAIPASRWLRIVGVFAGLLLALAVPIAAIIALIAWPQPEPFGEAFAKLAGQAANAALVPAALLSALITLSSKTLQVDRSVGKPESDEQFESIFADLVSDSGARRLVIFVDEIDRCSPDEVVATLDAIRTFLGADNCVFVVAADQHVLEESLTQAAKHETPTDEANPYYSTGSAYLDKIFQYQVSLPPLLSQRITRFAADLVNNREGLWSEIVSDHVVSVLVPTHVTSPRRVKHLLNAFALSYRLAEERHRQGLLAANPSEFAASLAKLVCLRVEFPLFARDLQIDARLPEMVLYVLHDPEATEFDRSWNSRAIERAQAYAVRGAAPASLMTDEPTGDDDDVQRTALSSNQQLLDYLRRTKAVAGPSRDLVYMHSSGAAFGLDGELAMAIEDAAEVADFAAVRERLAVDDPELRRGAIDLMNHLLRTSVGLGAANVAHTLLNLIASDEALPISHVADAASESIAFIVDTQRQVLDDATAEAAWKLAATGSSDGARRLREATLDYLESDPNASKTFLLRHPEPALDAHRDSLARLSAAAIVHGDQRQCTEALGHLSDATLLDFLQACRDEIAEELAQAFSDFKKPAPTAVSASAADLDEPIAPAPDPQPTVELITGLLRERASDADIAQQLVLLLLSIDNQAGRDAVEPLISDIGPVYHAPLVSAVLRAAQRRVLGTWPQWYDNVDSGAIEPHHAPLLQKSADTLWTSIIGNEPPTVSTVQRAADSLNGLINRLPAEDRLTLDDAVIASMASVVSTDAEANSRSAVLRKLPALHSAQLISNENVYGRLALTLHDTLTTDFGSIVERDGPLASYLYNDIGRILHDGVAHLDEPQSTVQQLISDVRESPWFEEPFSTELQLKLIVDSGLAATLSDGIDEGHIMSIIDRFTTGASLVAELWLQVGNLPFDRVLTLVTKLRAHGIVTKDIADVLTELRRRWTHEQRVALVRSQIEDPDSSRLTQVGASLIGLHEIGDEAAADILIERFNKCHNNTQRRGLVALWQLSDLKSEGARRRMINSVVIGLLQPADGSGPGVGQIEIALDTLSHVGDPVPNGVKRALGKAVKDAVAGKDKLEKRAIEVLEALGYKTERRGLLRKKDINLNL